MVSNVEKEQCHVSVGVGVIVLSGYSSSFVSVLTVFLSKFYSHIPHPIEKVGREGETPVLSVHRRLPLNAKVPQLSS